MNTRRLLLAIAAVGMLGASATPVVEAASPAFGKPIDATGTADGRAWAQEAGARWHAGGVDASVAPLEVWQLGPADYLVTSFNPVNLRPEVVRQPDGSLVVNAKFDVSANPGVVPKQAAPVSAASAGWSWTNQGCFSRISSAVGWIDSCFVTHRLTGETDPRDFYQLEQYGTVGTQLIGKIYSGWLAADKASGSSAMSWIDWSPRGTLTGSCQTVPLSVSALGQSISASGVMCERWNVYKYAAAGSFKEEWSCGCIVPFGQPYPNTREVDYMQAVSVPGGGSAIWTLSAGFVAAP